VSAARVIVEDALALAAAPGARAPTVEVGPADAAATGRAAVPQRLEEGALVCVAGTCGRAGATTVALLLAWHACREGRRVLCCDAAGPAGDLARLAGARSARSLAQSAVLLDGGRLDPDGLYGDRPGRAARDRHRPRGAPDRRTRGRAAAVACPRGARSHRRRRRHARRPGRERRQHASQLAWVLPATSEGRMRGQRTLDAVGRHPTARELIVARGCEPELGRVRPRELGQLASGRHSPVILLPRLGRLELPAGREAALEQCRPGLRELSRLIMGARAR
jgi:hypothetical protein